MVQRVDRNARAAAMNNAVGKIFNDASSNKRETWHRARASELKALAIRAFNENTPMAFYDAILQCIYRMLDKPVANTYVKTARIFLGRFLERFDLESDTDVQIANDLVLHVLEGLLPGVDAKSNPVRTQTLQVMLDILERGIINEESRDFITEIANVILSRSYDRQTGVRKLACEILDVIKPLVADPDGIDKRLQEVLSCDPDSSVRKVALWCMMREEREDLVDLNLILYSLRDPSINVRRDTYDRLRDVPLEYIEPEVGEQVLSGLEDPSATIRDAAWQTLATWLKGADGRILDVLESLDVMDEDTVCNTVVKTVLKKVPKLLKTMDLTEHISSQSTAEHAFLVRSVLEYCKENRLDLPELPPLGDYVACMMDLRSRLITDTELSEQGERILQFTFAQMLQTLNYYEIDEYSRPSLSEALNTIIRSEDSRSVLDYSVVHKAVQVLRRLFDSDESFIRQIIDFIADYSSEESLNALVADARRNIALSESALQNVTTLAPEFVPTFLVIIKSALDEGNSEDIRELGARGLGLIGILSKDECQEIMEMIRSILMEIDQCEASEHEYDDDDDEEMKDPLEVPIAARYKERKYLLGSLCDVLITYPSDGQSKDRFFDIIVGLTENRYDMGSKETAWVALEKLFISGALTDNRLLTSMLEKYASYLPDLDESKEEYGDPLDWAIIRSIEVFFRLYGQIKPENSLAIAEAFRSLMADSYKEIMSGDPDASVILPLKPKEIKARSVFFDKVIEWTNPEQNDPFSVAADSHAVLARAFFEALTFDAPQKELSKMVLSKLSKLRFSEANNYDLLVGLLETARELENYKEISDYKKVYSRLANRLENIVERMPASRRHDGDIENEHRLLEPEHPVVSLSSDLEDVDEHQ